MARRLKTPEVRERIHDGYLEIGDEECTCQLTPTCDDCAACTYEVPLEQTSKSETLQTLIRHELQRINDAHVEGMVEWNETVIIRANLREDEAMSAIHVYQTRGVPPPRKDDAVITLKEWQRRVRDLEHLL